MLQDDLLHPSLTAYETLYYTALLKLPRSLTMENKVARVGDMVKVMGLERCQHTIVSGGLLQAYFSGISGGERRRLSVAIELISDPSALLLGDAPLCDQHIASLIDVLPEPLVEIITCMMATAFLLPIWAGQRC